MHSSKQIAYAIKFMVEIIRACAAEFVPLIVSHTDQSFCCVWRIKRMKLCMH